MNAETRRRLVMEGKIWSAVNYVEHALVPPLYAAETAVENDISDARMIQVLQATLCLARLRLLALAEKLDDERIDLLVFDETLQDIELQQLRCVGE